MSNQWFTTGSIQIQPFGSQSKKLKFGWTSMTGSTIIATPDRTGQIVRHSDDPDVWLVRESDRPNCWHIIVNERNEERRLGEDCFWSWGSWQKLAG